MQSNVGLHRHCRRVPEYSPCCTVGPVVDALLTPLLVGTLLHQIAFISIAVALSTSAGMPSVSRSPPISEQNCGVHSRPAIVPLMLAWTCSSG
eukprot:3351437-Rhodomonas_salina.3